MTSMACDLPDSEPETVSNTFIILVLTFRMLGNFSMIFFSDELFFVYECLKLLTEHHLDFERGCIRLI